MQNRPKECLLLRSTTSKILEVHPVLLGRLVTRIPLPMFWLRTRWTNFYKTTKNLNSDSTRNHHSNHRLPVRYALDDPSNKRSEHGKRHIDFSLIAIGFYNKSEKISTASNPEAGIVWTGNTLSKHDSNFINGKSKKLNSEMQKSDGKPLTLILGNYKLHRFTLVSSTSCDASIFTNKISATTASGITKKAISLLLNSLSGSKFNFGTSMVGKQPRNIKSELNFVTYK